MKNKKYVVPELSAVKIDTKDVMTFSFGYGYDGEDNYMNDPF